MKFTLRLSGQVQPVVAIGAGVGGLVAGLLIGLAATYLFITQSYKKKMLGDRFVDVASSHGSPDATTYAHLPQDFHYRVIPTTSTSGNPTHTSSSPSGVVQQMGSGGSLQYHVEPFVMPGEDGRLVNATRPTGQLPETVSSPTAPQQQSHVYVLHHDSNIPPVTIFHESGTEIVELPPRYPPNGSQSDVLSEGQTRTDSRSDGSRTEASQSLALHQPRQPTQVRKPLRS